MPFLASLRDTRLAQHFQVVARGGLGDGGAQPSPPALNAAGDRSGDPGGVGPLSAPSRRGKTISLRESGDRGPAGSQIVACSPYERRALETSMWLFRRLINRAPLPSPARRPGRCAVNGDVRGDGMCVPTISRSGPTPRGNRLLPGSLSSTMPDLPSSKPPTTGRMGRASHPTSCHTSPGHPGH